MPLQDPDAKKPEDWDERAKIPDPEDKKPEGWDDIPEKIPDSEAKQPVGAWQQPGAWRRRGCAGSVQRDARTTRQAIAQP